MVPLTWNYVIQIYASEKIEVPQRTEKPLAHISLPRRLNNILIYILRRKFVQVWNDDNSSHCSHNHSHVFDAPSLKLLLARWRYSTKINLSTKNGVSWYKRHFKYISSLNTLDEMRLYNCMTSMGMHAHLKCSDCLLSMWMVYTWRIGCRNEGWHSRYQSHRAIGFGRG